MYAWMYVYMGHVSSDGGRYTLCMGVGAYTR